MDQPWFMGQDGAIVAGMVVTIIPGHTPGDSICIIAPGQVGAWDMADPRGFSDITITGRDGVAAGGDPRSFIHPILSHVIIIMDHDQ